MCKCSPGFFERSQRFSHLRRCEAAVGGGFAGLGCPGGQVMCDFG